MTYVLLLVNQPSQEVKLLTCNQYNLLLDTFSFKIHNILSKLSLACYYLLYTLSVYATLLAL